MIKNKKQQFSRKNYPKSSLKFLAKVKNLANKLAEKFPENTISRTKNGGFFLGPYIVYSESIRGVFSAVDMYIHDATYNSKRKYGFTPPEKNCCIIMYPELTGERNKYTIDSDGKRDGFSYYDNNMNSIIFNRGNSIFGLAYAMTVYTKYRWKLVSTHSLKLNFPNPKNFEEQLVQKNEQIAKIREKLKIPVDKDGNVVKVEK